MKQTIDRHAPGGVFGLTWAQLDDMQQGRRAPQRIDTNRPGDYGADPLGEGRFRMVPSGDIVDRAERNRRLAR